MDGNKIPKSFFVLHWKYGNIHSGCCLTIFLMNLLNLKVYFFIFNFITIAIAFFGENAKRNALINSTFEINMLIILTNFSRNS